MTWLKGVLMASPSACSKGGSLLMAIFKSLSACLKGCFLPMIPKYCLRALRLALNMYNNFLDRMHNAYAYQLCIFGVDADIVSSFHACTQGQLRVMLRVQQKKHCLVKCHRCIIRCQIEERWGAAATCPRSASRGTSRCQGRLFEAVNPQQQLLGSLWKPG